MSHDYSLTWLTTEMFAELVHSDRPIVVLQPVGSVEPHGPHLTLLTDTIISKGAALFAADKLLEEGVEPLIGPAVPYGVTDCAAQFTGAVSIPGVALTGYLNAVVAGFLSSGVDHVCLVNNHLEPAHDKAVRKAAEGFEVGRASVACPLARRWARTLSDEFKSGQCHAGQYETSLVLAIDADGVVEEARRELPAVPVSLSDKLHQGITDFAEMGMNRAYAGAPAEATAEQGRELLEKLGDMIATEVLEGLEQVTTRTAGRNR